MCFTPLKKVSGYKNSVFLVQKRCKRGISLNQRLCFFRLVGSSPARGESNSHVARRVALRSVNSVRLFPSFFPGRSMTEKEGVLAAITVRIRNIMVSAGCLRQRDLETAILKDFGVGITAERHATLRRRVYDALSTFIALGLIVKEDKNLYWNGVSDHDQGLGLHALRRSAARSRSLGGSPASDSDEDSGEDSDRRSDAGEDSSNSSADSSSSSGPWEASGHGIGSSQEEEHDYRLAFPEGVLPDEILEKVRNMTLEESEAYVEECRRELEDLEREIMKKTAFAKSLEERKNYYTLFVKGGAQGQPKLSSHFLQSGDDAQSISAPLYVISLRAGRDARILSEVQGVAEEGHEGWVSRRQQASLALLLQGKHSTVLSCWQLAQEAAAHASVLQDLPAGM